MTPERFEDLAEAYGGDVARWPVAERDAAAALMAADPERTRDILARARDLDALLDAGPALSVPAVLVDRIVSQAPRPRGPGWIRWLLPVGMGAGLAAACAAGVVVGIHVSTPGLQGGDEPDAMVTALSDDDVSLYLDEEAG